MVRRKKDLAELFGLYELAQMTRQKIAEVFTSPRLNLHKRFIDLGYKEMDPVVCEYGENYTGPEVVLSERGDEDRSLTILLPAEFVPGSRASEMLKDRSSSKLEVYAVYG